MSQSDILEKLETTGHIAAFIITGSIIYLYHVADKGFFITAITAMLCYSIIYLTRYLWVLTILLAVTAWFFKMALLG